MSNNDSEKKSALIALGIFALGVLSVLPFFWLFDSGSINDEGIVSLGAFRLWLGDAAYKDFVTHFTPGTYYLNLIFFYIFGPGIFATRLTMALMTGGLALAIYLISKSFLPGRYAYAPCLLFLCAGVTQWPILSYHWGGVLAFCWGTVALIHWNKNPGRLSASLCGASFAWTCWMLQSEAAALLLLTGLVTLDRRKEMTRYDFLFWFCGFGVLSFILWAPVLLRTSVWSVWYHNVYWTILHNAAPGQSPYEISRITSRWASFSQQLSSAQMTGAVFWWACQSISYLLVWSTNYLAFYPILLLSIAVGWKHKENRTFRIVVYAQLATCLAWQSRQTLLYLNFLTPLFFVLLVYLLYRSKAAGKVLLVGISAYYLSAYAFWCKEASSYIHPIRTPRGTLFTSRAVEAQYLNDFFRTAAQLTPPGTPTFCYPYAMSIYFLTGVRPVSRQPTVIPIFLPEEELPELVDSLAREKPPYIYYIPWGQETLQAVPRVDEKKFWSLVEEYDKQIQQGYSRVTQFGPIQVLKRNDS